MAGIRRAAGTEIFQRLFLRLVLWEVFVVETRGRGGEEECAMKFFSRLWVVKSGINGGG